MTFLPGPVAGPRVRWIDSHCHLQLGDDRAGAGGGGADAVARAVDAGVERMICIGTDLATSEEAVALAAEHGEVWATVGLHPHDASRLDAEWDGLRRLAGAERVVGVGETGFDLYYRHSTPKEQEEAFRRHIRLAAELGLALVIHCRDAWEETFSVLASEGVPERSVFHCFTGGPDEAARALAAGAWLSFSGIASFRNAEPVRAAAAAVPAGRLLIETDSPFLAPIPYRGRPNQPAYLPAVGAAVAAARGTTPETVAEVTRANALAVFWPTA